MIILYSEGSVGSTAHLVECMPLRNIRHNSRPRSRLYIRLKSLQKKQAHRGP